MVDPVAVQVAGLVKRYPKSRVDAVGGISFAVRPGEVFGLLGPNGAGKTTTVGVLTTRVRPTAGQACVAGVDVVADPVGARRCLAVVPQRNNLDRSLSIRQNLLFHAAYHGRPARESAELADRLLAQFGLTGRAADRVDRFSGGQEQRVMIARALMHTPQVLFLDEPSTGLDPAARLFVWDRVRELRDGGTTVVLTTHDMHEAAQLADRVGIMDRGQLLALGTPAELTRSLPGRTTLDLTAKVRGHSAPDGRDAAEQLEAALVRRLAGLAGVQRAERLEDGAPAVDGDSAGAMPGTLRARLYLTGEAPELLGPVAQLLAGQGAQLTDVALGIPTLEDVFLHLTGRTLR